MGDVWGPFLLQGGEFERFGDHCRLMPRGACGIEMRMGGVPIRESVSYAPPRVHFYVGDFGY